MAFFCRRSGRTDPVGGDAKERGAVAHAGAGGGLRRSIRRRMSANRSRGIGGNDLHVMLGGIALGDRNLVVRRVLLVLGRHPEIPEPGGPGGHRRGRVSSPDGRCRRATSGAAATVMPGSRRSGIVVEHPGTAASDWRKSVSAEITELALPAGSETAGRRGDIRRIPGDRRDRPPARAIIQPATAVGQARCRRRPNAWRA